MKIPFSIECPLKTIFNTSFVFKCNFIIFVGVFFFLYIKKYTFVNTVSTKKSDSQMRDFLGAGCCCIFRKGFKLKSHCRNLFPFPSLLRNAVS